MATALGLVAVLILCLPGVGYISPMLSGVGLILGSWGLVRTLRQVHAVSPAPYRFGARASDYPLAGTVACLLALALALLPFLVR